MPDAASSSLPSHPSPHRDRVGAMPLLVTVWGGPLAWIGQLLVNYGLVAYPCFPDSIPRTQILSGWHWAWPLALALNIAAALAALVAAFQALRYWRRTRDEMAGSPHHAIEAGEGRTRFLALCGAMTGFGFFAAILFNTIGVIVVPQCVG